MPTALLLVDIQTGLFVPPLEPHQGDGHASPAVSLYKQQGPSVSQHDQRCHIGTSIAKWGLCSSEFRTMQVERWRDDTLLSQVWAFAPQPAGNNLAG